MIKSNLRILMAQNKIDNIKDLMIKSGLSRNAINRIYKETEIDKADLKTLIQLCDTFKCSLSDLIEYTPNE
jgi:putative transcriptional regulator